MTVATLMRPMHKRPVAGQKIIVYKKTGGKLDCCATRITMTGFSGIMIYNNGRVIDEDKMSGWWPSV